MAQRVTWLACGLLAVIAVIGIVELIMTGSCGCPANALCAAPPCPASAGIWFACTFVGSFGAAIALTAAWWMRWNARNRRYQAAQGPVSAELPVQPMAFPPTGSVLPKREWSTPPISPVVPAGDPSQPFGGALGGYGSGSTPSGDQPES